MNLDKFLDEPYLKAGIGKEKINEKAKTIEELASFSVKHDNSFYFEDFGLDEKSESIKNPKIKKDILNILNKDDKELIKDAMEAFLSFVAGPIFTDQYNIDHANRRIWENDNLKNKGLSLEAKKYYDSNRLDSNRGWGKVVNYIELIIDMLAEYNELNDIVVELKNLQEKIPHEFSDEYEDESKIKYRVYDRLPDDIKVNIIKQLTKITDEFVSFLVEGK